MTNIRVSLADDHPIVLTGICALIEAEGDIQVANTSTSGAEALAAIKASLPDVAVIDISMPDYDGIELIKALKTECPSVRMLALTVHEDQGYVHQALRAGVHGYLLKRSAAEDLIRAVRAVASGAMYLDPAVAAKAIAPRAEQLPQMNILSDRETDVLRFLAQGFTTKEIAEQLSISIKTVDTYKIRAAGKLELRTRVQIIRYAAAQGWLADL